MIIYRCKCGSEFRAGKKHTRKGKDGKDKHTYMGSEQERKAKRAWKDEHGTRKGHGLTEKEIHNPGHGYIRYSMRKSDIKDFQ